MPSSNVRNAQFFGHARAFPANAETRRLGQRVAAGAQAGEWKSRTRGGGVFRIEPFRVSARPRAIVHEAGEGHGAHRFGARAASAPGAHPCCCWSGEGGVEFPPCAPDESRPGQF